MKFGAFPCAPMAIPFHSVSKPVRPALVRRNAEALSMTAALLVARVDLTAARLCQIDRFSLLSFCNGRLRVSPRSGPQSPLFVLLLMVAPLLVVVTVGLFLTL